MRTVLSTLILIFPTILCAQKIKLTQGSLSALKGQKEISIEYTYDAVMIGTATDEKSYVERKKSEWNTKEPGKGDSFEQYWYNSRKSLYETIFTFQFDKSSSMGVAKTSKAPYTIILKTKRIEPGWNAGVVGKKPTIDGHVWIVSSDDPNNVLAIISFENCSGEDALGGDFEMGRRIQSAYYVAASELAKFIEKKL